MVSHRSTGIALVTFVVLSFALLGACDKVPLLAPTGSVITLLPVTTTVSLNSEVTIIATVIENGQAIGGSGTGTATRVGAGTPVQNGTLVSFTTTIGRIEPAEARTHNGQVSVRFITAGASGTARITAYSGGASSSTELKVGTAAAGRVLLSATPQALGVNGGSVQVIASVTDEGGSPLVGVPVSFATDKGSLSPSTAITDASGNATATLTTTATAKVTATAGSIASNEVTVTVNARSLASFAVVPTSAPAGVPVVFTVTPTEGANIGNVRVDFGDGDRVNLGALTAAQPVPHAYRTPGFFTATATAFEPGGAEGGSLSTTVLISSLSVGLAVTPVSPSVNSPVTVTATVPTGTAVDHYVFTFSDGTVIETTNNAVTRTFTTPGTKTARVDVFVVGGGQIGTNTITFNVAP